MKWQNYEAFRSLVGSHAYGLNTESSDEDWRGIYIAPTRHIIGISMSPPDSIKIADEEDSSLWELGKFVNLALQSNPNVIEILWADRVDVQPTYDTFTSGLMGLKKEFLSQRASRTYGGYATQQWHNWQRQSGGDRSHPRNVSPAARKACMHMFRLLISATHLLSTGDLLVRMSDDDARMLLKVRSGEIGKVEISDIHDKLESDFAYAKENTVLPEEPNKLLINEWITDIRYRYW